MIGTEPRAVLFGLVIGTGHMIGTEPRAVLFVDLLAFAVTHALGAVGGAFVLGCSFRALGGTLLVECFLVLLGRRRRILLVGVCLNCVLLQPVSHGFFRLVVFLILLCLRDDGVVLRPPLLLELGLLVCFLSFNCNIRGVRLRFVRFQLALERGVFLGLLVLGRCLVLLVLLLVCLIDFLLVFPDPV